MQNISFKPTYKSVKANGMAKIYILIIIDRKPNYYPTTINVIAADFDKKAGAMKKHAKNYNEISYLIDEQIKIVKDKTYLLQINKQVITYEKLINEAETEILIIDYAKNVIRQKEKYYTKGTLRKNNAEITKLEQLTKTLTINDFNLAFIKEFENYMSETLNNKTNTIAKTFSFWRMVLNEAIKDNLTTSTPFAKYKLKKEPTTRIFLSLEQLASMEKLLNVDIVPPLKNTIKAFLFGCYTGLRYSDIKNLKAENLQHDRLLFIQEKTGEQIALPLTDKAKKLIDFEAKELDFKIYTNESYNVYLKEIAKTLGLPAKLSFHSSRHTFATTAIELGIPIEIISKLLGHNDIKTTQIYAKITDRKKFEEMKKFNL